MTLPLLSDRPGPEELRRARQALFLARVPASTFLHLSALLDTIARNGELIARIDAIFRRAEARRVHTAYRARRRRRW